jgi:mannose-6-phosphate isomerase-like protein (cupin superfamily)
MQPKKVTSNAFAAGPPTGTAETLQEVNGQLVRRTTHTGTSGWFTYLHAEAFLLVAGGAVTIEFRDESLPLRTGDCLVIPVRSEYRLVADAGVTLLVFEARFAPAFAASPYQTPGYLW